MKTELFLNYCLTLEVLGKVDLGSLGVNFVHLGVNFRPLGVDLGPWESIIGFGNSI